MSGWRELRVKIVYVERGFGGGLFPSTIVDGLLVHQWLNNSQGLKASASGFFKVSNRSLPGSCNPASRKTGLEQLGPFAAQERLPLRLWLLFFVLKGL